MLGLIDVGGGNRGSYGCGIMDRFLKENFKVDYGIGVSAGSANLASYFAHQMGRNYAFYTEYNLRKEAMGLGNYVRHGSFVNVEYIYGTITNRDGENPLDYARIVQEKIPYWIVATDAETGKPVYLDGLSMEQDDYGAFKASSNVPAVDQPYAWREHLYYDGAISDPIPVEKALADGCDHVIVILTRPKDYFRKSDSDEKLAKLMKKYPAAQADLIHRAEVYNRELKLCLDLEKEDKVKILAPASIHHMKTLGQNAQGIKDLYVMGWHDAAEGIQWGNAHR